MLCLLQPHNLFPYNALPGVRAQRLSSGGFRRVRLRVVFRIGQVSSSVHWVAKRRAIGEERVVEIHPLGVVKRHPVRVCVSVWDVYALVCGCAHVLYCRFQQFAALLRLLHR